MERAVLFVDGRYTLQVRAQVDGDHWSYQSVPETSIADWLKTHAPEGGRIGYDPWLHTREWVGKAREALADRGAELVAVRRNPIDAVWGDQPEPSRARLIVHPDEFAGKSSAAKRQEMADWLKEQKADAAVLAALDSIAWTFNVRGKDVERTPVALSFALVRDDGTADLFVDGEKIGDDVRQHLGNGVRIHERSEFEGALGQLAGIRGEDKHLTRDVTILLADLRGFTSISANYPAVIVLELLNRCFVKMSEIIFKHHGGIEDDPHIRCGRKCPPGQRAL